MTDESTEERFRRRQQEFIALNLAREGLIRVGHGPMLDTLLAMKETVPTLAHAARFYEAAANALGEDAVVDVESMFGRRAIFVRDAERPEWIVPVPAAELYVGRTKNLTFIIAAAPPAPPAPLDVAPRGELAKIGELWINEGDSRAEIHYDERGVFRDCELSSGDNFTFEHRKKEEPFTIDPLARPPAPPPIAMLVAPEVMNARGDVEALAGLLSAANVRERVPVRALFPVPIPDGADVAWARARGPMHLALVEERVPPEAAWLVCDGFDGSAIAWGRDLDEAMARWRDEVFRKKPRPQTPAASNEEPRGIELLEPGTDRRDEEKGTRTVGLGKFRISAPALPTVMAWPPATPRNVPAIAVPLSSLPVVPEPARAAGFTRWVRCLGPHGRVLLALRRDEPDGSTWLGEHVLDLVDPATIGGEIDRAEAEHYDGYDEEMDPRRDPAVVHYLQGYSVWDDARRERVAPRMRGGTGAAFEPLHALGDAPIAWEVVRIRQLQST